MRGHSVCVGFIFSQSMRRMKRLWRKSSVLSHSFENSANCGVVRTTGQVPTMSCGKVHWSTYIYLVHPIINSLVHPIINSSNNTRSQNRYAPNVRTLADTLWRQLVMCGNMWDKLSENPVVRLLRNALKIKKQKSTTSRRRQKSTLGLSCFGGLSGRGLIWDQLQRDRKDFCLLSGTTCC